MKRSSALLLACAVCGSAQVKIDSSTFGAMQARAIGPAVTGGRITAIDGVNRDSRIVYVGAAGGGVWKTTNGGGRFRPVFDQYSQSIGAITVDQAHPETVWVGTGEPWVRNSTSIGTGIYKTSDAGESWKLMGLEKSERIGRIVVDPKNSDTVYAAVLGHLWNSSEDRGLYKTTDGGKSWRKILYADPDTGCADVALDPQEPGIVYASMWQFRRKAWSFASGGKGSGLYRSTDGGEKWERVRAGLPDGDLGRIAIAVAPSRPNVVYAAVESKNSALYRSDDLGKSWTREYDGPEMGQRPFYFSLLVVDPKDYEHVYKPGMFLSQSRDGGKVFQSGLGGFHPDTHALWIDPAQTSTLYLGTDGGVFKSLDGGLNWSFLRGLPVSQVYRLATDNQKPFHVYGGLQDNGSWTAPSQGRAGVQARDWRNVGMGDGFSVFPDPAHPEVGYSEYQGGKLFRFDLTTGEIKAVQPTRKQGEARFRFNWNAPALSSPHDPNTIYLGGQYLFRSRNRGESWDRISPDLTTNDKAKENQEESGGVTVDNSAAENYCTIYSIAESPLDANTIWAGTDDGNLQLTRDGGKSWANLTAKLPAAAAGGVISSVEPSHHAAGTAYVTVDSHQSGDMTPHVFKTTDFGASWTALVSEAIHGYAHVVREDLAQPGLLFVGTELGLFLSVDGGQRWAQFTGNLPPVPVRDLAIHARDSSLVIATHGRGIYVVDDITPIRQITGAVLESNLTVLSSQPSVLRLASFDQDFGSADEFMGANPPEAAWITYYLKDRHVMGDFVIQVFDSAGKLVTTLPAGTRRGINRVAWPMRGKAPKVPVSESSEGGVLLGPLVPEGDYIAKLVKNGETFTAPIHLVPDDRLPHSKEDRVLQQTTARRLYDLIERLAFLSAQVGNLREQVGQRSAALKPNDALRKDLEGVNARLQSLQVAMAATKKGGMTGEIRLAEEMGEVYGEVNSYGGRPTQSQLERAQVLEKEADESARQFDGLVATELQTANTKLAARSLRPLQRLTREQYDRTGR